MCHVRKDVKVRYCIMGSRALNKTHLISEIFLRANYIGHFAVPENFDVVSMYLKGP